MSFHDAYANRPKSTKESGGRISKVEVAGYVPAKKRIEDMMAAGLRLVASRSTRYDTTDPKAKLIPDPTRRLDFDRAEASMMSRDVNARLRAAQAKKAASKEAVKDKPVDEKPASEKTV